MSAIVELDDMLQLQSDVASALASCDIFDPVHVVERRKKRLQSELDFVGFLSSPKPAKGGRAGVLLSVEMPVFTVPDPNVSGPQKLMVLSVLVLEHDGVNYAEGGTRVPAETWANLVLDFLHHWMPRDSVAITADDAAIVPATDFRQLIGYLVTVRLPRFRSAVTRTKVAAMVQAGASVTFTNHADNALAEVWYTLDGSFPSDKSRNPGSTSSRYSAPFAVTAGKEMRWAAYVSGQYPSNVGTATTN